MKRQADGISCRSEDLEPAEPNGNKRIKLLVGSEEKSVMDMSSNENSHNNENSQSIANNISPCKHNDTSSENISTEKDSNKNMKENESVENSLNHIANNCNTSPDEKNVSDKDSDIFQLCYSQSHENSVAHSEENTVRNDVELEPPVLNHCDHDLQNNESTDSFQSEGFEAHNIRAESETNIFEKHRNESSYNISEEHQNETNYESFEKKSSQQQNNDFEKEFSFESDLKKNCIDVDNLTLSHLKVTELQGHTEEVLSVAADEDFILSSSADTTVKVWNTERQNIVSTFSGHSNTVTSLLFLSPNQSKKIKKKLSLTKVSRIAITGSLDCHIKLWSVLEGKELASVYTFNGITSLGYLESECLVILGTEGGKLELWNLSSKEAIISQHAHEDKITDIKVKDDYIYSVSIDGSAKVWSYEDDDIYPVYSRKRKEISSDKTGFKPTQWETVAVSDNVMYLGDCTNSIKVLDWKVGRLSLYKNQLKSQGICDCIITEDNILFSTYYDSSIKTGGVNVWKLPEMTYVCTLTGDFPKINSLAIIQQDNKLKIIAGGHKLFICEFDFSKPPSSEGEFYVREWEMLGNEMNENFVDIKKTDKYASNTSRSEESSSSNRWCNIM